LPSGAPPRAPWKRQTVQPSKAMAPPLPSVDFLILQKQKPADREILFLSSHSHRGNFTFWRKSDANVYERGANSRQ
jgi:hypothetical protein